MNPRWFAVAPASGLVAAAAHLAWEATHGGIRSHHLLNRADLPAVSNAWGLLVLPLLGWLAAYFVGRRARDNPKAPGAALVAFAGSLLAGLALSTSFRLGLDEVTASVFIAFLLSGMALRSYRAEYLFGFVLGMTFVFGSVLPTLAAAIAASLSVVSHFVVYPAMLGIYRRVARASA